MTNYVCFAYKMTKLLTSALKVNIYPCFYKNEQLFIVLHYENKWMA